jgi:hypothetical protein
MEKSATSASNVSLKIESTEKVHDRQIVEIKVRGALKSSWPPLVHGI